MKRRLVPSPPSGRQGYAGTERWGFGMDRLRGLGVALILVGVVVAALGQFLPTTCVLSHPWNGDSTGTVLCGGPVQAQRFEAIVIGMFLIGPGVALYLIGGRRRGLRATRDDAACQN